MSIQTHEGVVQTAMSDGAKVFLLVGAICAVALLAVGGGIGAYVMHEISKD